MKQLIFLVDDDEDDCFLVQHTLRPKANCELRSFHNGSALIHQLNGQPHALPDLILLDLNMPFMNGFETLAVLKKHPDWTAIPTIILTTSDHQNDRERSYALGADGFLTKPADFQSLSDVLASISDCWRAQ
ncbi:response regulator [Spirosoma taeanense]|uniref:Response regulator n=1 Tax=Spirosoma taeanense TaxID=2735870 RepID=A0A6M5Y7G2_9BACT|nr:response regulator [Spirosoma taeanense]QJW89835.1 response regulator [Spirosoma taeanense]